MFDPKHNEEVLQQTASLISADNGKGVEVTFIPVKDRPAVYGMAAGLHMILFTFTRNRFAKLPGGSATFDCAKYLSDSYQIVLSFMTQHKFASKSRFSAAGRTRLTSLRDQAPKTAAI